jgi:SecD/SecF fusion protein
MKSIIYFLIASLIYCTLTSGSLLGQVGTRIIFLKPAGTNFTAAVLEQSAIIISARFKTYGIEKYDVIPLPDKGQLKVQIPDNLNLSEIEGLLTLKGDLAFYETFNRKEVSDLLKGDNQLFRLMNSDPGITPADSRIGCTNVENRFQVNAYLQKIKNPDNCKFVWTYWGLSSDKSQRCLYALKTSTAGKPLIIRSDIENTKAEQASDGKSFNFLITFKNSAAGLWADATRKNMNRSIAITLDNTVFYAPVVRAVIEKGVCEINGDMTQKDVNYLLALTNNSSLPVAFELVK